MATIFQCTMIFDGPKHGWQESWMYNSSTDSYLATMAALQKLCKARAAMLGNQVSIIGQRVSRVDLKNEGYAIDDVYTNQGQSESCDSDEPDAAVLLRAYDAAFQRKKLTYLRGIPDSIDIQFGKLVTDPCGWGKAFDAYAKLLGTGFGWMGRPAAGPLRSDIVTYTTLANGLVTIQTKDPLFNLLPVNKKIKITIGGLNKPSKSILNGQQTVAVLGDSLVTTLQPVAVFPYESGGHVLYAAPEFIPCAVANYARIVTRRVGAPLLRSRGRGPVRAKG